MMVSQFNIFDGVVIGIMALSCLFAYFRGLVREILSLVAWVGAGIITICYFPWAAEKLEPHFKNPMVAAAIGGVGLYIGALIGFALINTMIVKTIKGGGEGGVLDNMLGLLFGALRGALIISLGFFLLTVAMPQKPYPDWVTQSVTHPYVEKGAQMLAQVAPDYLREVSSLEKKATDKWHPHGDDDGTGYSTSETSSFERLNEISNKMP